MATTERLACLALVIAGMCFGGCSPEPQEPATKSNAYTREFAQALEHARSDFVKEVLADDEISVAEFDEALNSMVDCLQTAGIDAIIEESDSGVGQVIWPTDHEDMAAVRKCEQEWDGGIIQLYRLVWENPNNVPIEDIQAACLVQEGMVPKGFTGEELAQLHSLASEEIYHSEDGSEATIKPVVNPTPTLPGGTPLYSDQTEDCLHRPWQTLRLHSSSGDSPR